MKFSKDEKIKILLITLSVISLIGSLTLSLDYIAGISIILCGIPIFKECIEGLISEFDIKADLLVSIAIVASILIGEIFAAGEIATIMAIGGFLEEHTVSKTHKKIEELIKLTPKTAIRITNGIEEKIDIEDIKIGDILKIVPGESIPTDGIIIKGETSVNQSTLTGESLPVDKKEKDEVYSGTTNLYGSFTMKATKISENSSLQKLIQLVKTSSPENAKIVRAADKWATMIVVIAFTASILTYLFTFEISRSVTILVVFCPCALVLATPTAITAAIGNLTKHGILVKDGSSIEELGHINEIIFDKTGTLTKGMLEVIKIESYHKDMMKLLASIESKSEHPIAKAIVSHYNSHDIYEVNDFKTHLGKGVSGSINGTRIIAGNKAFLEDENIIINDNEYENEYIEIYIAIETEIIGYVALADTLRKNSKDTIEKLKNLNIKTTLLSGDNRKTVETIAKEVNVTYSKYECLPEDKCRYIEEKQMKGNRVAMIGDGINDAPSLKKANVGIAMADIGSDISVEAANIALINGNIEELPHLISISRKTLKIINTNIAFSLCLNITAMIMAILGLLDPISGALIHNIGSVIVIVYSSTLMNFKISENNNKHERLGMTKSLNKHIT